MSSDGRRLAIVTGGTRGIGRAVAGRLASDGYRCLVTGTTTRRPDTVPSEFEYHGVDLRSQSAVTDLADVVTRLRPAVLVNNVGINIKGETAEFGMQEYDHILQVNLRAP